MGTLGSTLDTERITISMNSTGVIEECWCKEAGVNRKAGGAGGRGGTETKALVFLSLSKEKLAWAMSPNSLRASHGALGGGRSTAGTPKSGGSHFEQPRTITHLRFEISVIYLGRGVI